MKIHGMRENETKIRFFLFRSLHRCLKLLKIAIWIILNDALVSFTSLLTPFCSEKWANAFFIQCENWCVAHTQQCQSSKSISTVNPYIMQDIKVYAITLKTVTAQTITFHVHREVGNDERTSLRFTGTEDISLLICHRCVYQ